jgi:formyltetrahydrofolate-dependent phosphoribosylglycinamide formyltransferase
LAAAAFVSGSGTNLQALLDHQVNDPPWRIRVVVSDRDGAGALLRAADAGVATRVVTTRGRDADAIAADTMLILDEHAIDVIFLAGYLSLVPAAIVFAYRGRILNIHPGLLPAFGGQGMYGMRVHRAVIESGASVSGATVHLVDEEFDRGDIVAQWPVAVLPGDTPESLAARVLVAEHRLYPMAADHVCRAIAAGKLPERLVVPHHI